MATLSVTATAANTPLTTITDGRHTYLIDEPPFFGGEDQAPSPVEMLLSALAGALNAIGQYVAKEMELPLRGLTIRVDGDCDAACFFGKSYENRPGFQQIRVDLSIDTDAEDRLVEEWKRRVLLRCPVLDNLTRPTDVVTTVKRG